jgi:cardiolipin synthase
VHGWPQFSAGVDAARTLLHARSMWAAHALTLSRIPLAALFWLTYGDLWWSCGIVALAALTDAADGWVARQAQRHGARRTETGAWLDPLCDKAFVVGVLAAVVWHEQPPAAVIAMIAARELLLAPLGLTYRIVLVLHPMAHEFRASLLGKATTVSQFLAMLALLLESRWVMPLAMLAAVLGVAATTQYVMRAVQLSHASRV